MPRVEQRANRFGVLLRPLADAFEDEVVRAEVLHLLRGIGESLGLRGDDLEQLPCAVRRVVTSDNPCSESVLRRWIFDRTSQSSIEVQLEERAKLIRSQVAPYVCGPRLADVGCGDGLVAQGFKHLGDVTLLDVVNYVAPTVDLPFVSYSGQGPLPLEQAVDCSLLLTVLHHSEDPIALLHGVFEATRRRVIVIESVVPDEDSDTFERQFLVAALFDWFYNRILHEDVPVPFNYNSVHGWTQQVERCGWTVSVTKDFGRDQPLVPERHVLFVLDRPSSFA